MKFLSFWLLFFLILNIPAATAQVATETFPIRLLVGSDNISPTTPVLLGVDPVSTTQINVNWSVATDNFSVAGYVLSRDGTAIATTTLLNYSDTGLTASTTYTYQVKAFDLAVNYSSSSNSLATTTLSVNVTPATTTATTTGSGSGGTVTRVTLDSLVVTEGVSTTSLQVVTSLPARLEVRWGRTEAYELGYVESGSLVKGHQFLLTDLEPDTKYYYQIIGFTPRGRETEVAKGLFVTLGTSVQSVAPTNAQRFMAKQSGSDVALSWRLPVPSDGLYVRVVRSHLGFPKYPQDGAIIYQGSGSSFLDEDILDQYSPVYYTIFVYDVFGNVSSGAIALVFASSQDEAFMDDPVSAVILDEIPGHIVDVLTVPKVIEEATSSIATDRVTVDMKMPLATDILLLQGGKAYNLQENNITLDSKQSFLMSVPYKTVAGNLKSIIVTVLDPTDNKLAYSYLLRINKDQTAYEAVVASMGVAGRSQIKLAIYDYEAFVVAEYQAPVVFKSAVQKPVDNDKACRYLAPSVSFVILVCLLAFFINRRHEDNQA